MISGKNYRKNSKNSRKFGCSLITVNFTVVFPEKFYPCTHTHIVTFPQRHRASATLSFARQVRSALGRISPPPVPFRAASALFKASSPLTCIYLYVAHCRRGASAIKATGGCYCRCRCWCSSSFSSRSCLSLRLGLRLSLPLPSPRAVETRVSGIYTKEAGAN